MWVGCIFGIAAGLVALVDKIKENKQRKLEEENSEVTEDSLIEDIDENIN